jgi:hypothetical protein
MARDLACSFCGKREDQVQKLIAGPRVFICDECVCLCNKILDEEGVPTPTPTDPRRSGGWMDRLRRMAVSLP